MNSALRGMVSLVKRIPKGKTCPRGKRQLLILVLSLLFWNSGFFRIPNYVFLFDEQKATARVSSPFDYMATLYASSPGDEWTATNLVSVVWKFTTCWFFWRALPRYQSWSKACLLANTHMANREWGLPMPISPCNDRKGGRDRETASPTATIL